MGCSTSHSPLPTCLTCSGPRGTSSVRRCTTSSRKPSSFARGDRAATPHRSGKKSPQLRCLCDALDADDERGVAQWHTQLFVTLPHRVERVVHGLFEALLEELGLPHESLEVLSPLEVGRDHPARVREHVGYD